MATPLTLSEREKLALLYAVAFERGDMIAIEQILARAEHDPTLDEMLTEISLAHATEQQLTQDALEAETIRQLLQQHLPTAFVEEAEAVPPPLTVGEIAARIKSQVVRRGAARSEAAVLAQQLQNSSEVVPLPARMPEIRRLLQSLGVRASAQFEKLFQDTTVFLAMGRGQSLMAATRRQKSVSNSSMSDKKG